MVERTLDIVVCGLTGTGKSMVANGIVGREVFKEGHDLKHETEKVTPHSWNDDDNKIRVTVFDTPGFEDDTSNGDRYRADIKNHCERADLLLYCISAQESRSMLVRDRKTLEHLKEVFDSSVWGHFIIVLTFSNSIVSRAETIYKKSSSKKQDVITAYEDAKGNWVKEIQEILKVVFTVEVADKVPIVPAGSTNCSSLLGNEKYWLSDLYHKAVDQTDDKKSDILILINCHRMKKASQVKEEDFKVCITCQPLVVTNEPCKTNRRLKILAGTLSAGGVSGAAGAGIGATIGALAIGLPTFGVAAGAGLVIGAAIGAAIGIAVGAGTYKIINTFVEKKHVLNEFVVVDIKFGIGLV